MAEVVMRNSSSAHRLGGALRKRLTARLAWMGAVVLVAGLVKLHAWWVSPEHRIEQFVASINHGDLAGMLARMDASEVARLGLTPTKFGDMLADATGAPGGVRVQGLTWDELNERQLHFDRYAHLTLRARNGAALANVDGGPLTVQVQAYNTDHGWKVDGSSFIDCALVARTGYAFRRGYYAALCARHGVAAEVLNPADGSWSEAPAAQ